MRTILGFLAAAIIPAFLIVGWYAYESLTAQFANDGFVWVRVRGFALTTLLISAAHVVVLGVPAFFLLRWRNAVYW